MDKQKEIKKIVNQIVKNYRPEKVILFGSFVSGCPRENSDVDLVVIKDTKKRFIRRLFEVCRYIKSWMGTDILVYTPKEWEEALGEENYFIKEIAEKGKVVYAR